VRTGGWIASQTYVTSLGRSSDRAGLTGRFSFVSNLGSTLGPLGAGAAAQMFGFRLAFIFLAVYAFAFALLGCYLPRVETSHVARKPGTGLGFRGAARLFTIRGIRVAMMLTGTRLWMSWTFAGFFPVLLVERGVGAGIAGSVVGFQGFVAMVTAPTAGFWCRSRSPTTVAGLGLGAGALGLTISPFVTLVPFVYLTPLLVGIGTGLSLPLLLTMVTQAAPAHQRGTALGLRQAVNNLAGAGAPLLVGPLITALGMGIAFGVSGGLAACVLVGAGFVAAGRDPEGEPESDAGASPRKEVDPPSRKGTGKRGG
jgi:MFS transporter, DHA1 family, inner membrane transport protein